MTDPLADLSNRGVSIWLAELSRPRLTTGSLADLVAHDHVVGVTTNPTIFAKAISGGDAYAKQIRDMRARGAAVGEALRAMAAFDVRWACDVLRPGYDATDGVDGRVSIKINPRLAHDTEATVAEARFLWLLVDRPNLLVKIPAARQGLPAIAACLAEGISGRRAAGQDRHRRGGRAARAGRDRQRAAGLPSLRADAHLAALGGSAGGGSPSAAAAVGLDLGQGPAYPDTRCVTDRARPGVVNTMPEAILRAVADHGRIPEDSVRGHYQDARQVLSELEALRVDYGDVTQGLESNGLAAFDASWRELGDQLRTALQRRPARKENGE